MRDKDNDEIVLAVLKVARAMLETLPRTEYTKDIVLPAIEDINLDKVKVYDRIVDAVAARKQGTEAVSLAQGYLLFGHNSGIISVGGANVR